MCDKPSGGTSSKGRGEVQTPQETNCGGDVKPLQGQVFKFLQMGVTCRARCGSDELVCPTKSATDAKLPGLASHSAAAPSCKSGVWMKGVQFGCRLSMAAAPGAHWSLAGTENNVGVAGR